MQRKAEISPEEGEWDSDQAWWTEERCGWASGATGANHARQQLSGKCLWQTAPMLCQAESGPPVPPGQEQADPAVHDRAKGVGSTGPPGQARDTNGAAHAGTEVIRLFWIVHVQLGLVQVSPLSRTLSLTLRFWPLCLSQQLSHEYCYTYCFVCCLIVVLKRWKMAWGKNTHRGWLWREPKPSSSKCNWIIWIGFTNRRYHIQFVHVCAANYSLPTKLCIGVTCKPLVHLPYIASYHFLTIL